MGLIRAYISNELEELLRKHLPSRRGAISRFVEDAIREKLRREGYNV